MTGQYTPRYMPAPYLDMTQVGELLSVTARTVSRYRSWSKRDGRYIDHPFPEPDGLFSGRAYWHQDRTQEILNWAAARPGQGTRPRKRA